MKKYIVPLYVLFIYATLYDARKFWNFLKAIFSIVQLNVIFYAIAVLLAFLLIFYLLKNFKGIELLLRIIALLFFALVLAVYFPQFHAIEERIHIFEYGLLAILLLWAYFPATRKWDYFYVMVLGFFIGWGDEFIQYLLPNRVYDLRDVVMNFLGVLFGMGLYAFVLKSEIGTENAEAGDEPQRSQRREDFTAGNADNVENKEADRGDNKYDGKKKDKSRLPVHLSSKSVRMCKIAFFVLFCHSRSNRESRKMLKTLRLWIPHSRIKFGTGSVRNDPPSLGLRELFCRILRRA